MKKIISPETSGLAHRRSWRLCAMWVSLTAAVAAALMIAGCAGSAGQVAKLSHNSRDDVFVVAAPGTQAPRGYARLAVSATLKTHSPGAHAVTDVHGTAEHVLLLNIDGQVIELAGSPRKEAREALPVRNPEEGEGMRYRFETTLDVKEGSRRITAVVPADEVVAGREVRLVAGTSGKLVLEPVYGAASGGFKPGAQPATSYRQGLATLRFCLDGEAP